MESKTAQTSNDESAIVKCGTSKGEFTMHLFREWSPNGYDRAMDLFDRGFYDHSHFFRCIHGFLVQFGISYTKDTELQQYAYNKRIPDDPQQTPPIKFQEGTVSFAGSGPNSRTSHLFIAYGEVPSLGTQPWETPVGYVEQQSMKDVMWKLYDGYGDNGPHQHQLMVEGKSYVDQKFPLLDNFSTCKTIRFDPHERRELLEERHHGGSEWNAVHFGPDGVVEHHNQRMRHKEKELNVNFVSMLAFGFVSASILIVKNRSKIWKKM